MNYKIYDFDYRNEAKQYLFELYNIYKKNKLLIEYEDYEITDFNVIFNKLIEEAVVIGNEVLYLISGGFFDGSQARIRTLYEYCKIMRTIKYSDDQEAIAIRYSFYNLVGKMKITNYKVEESDKKFMRDTYKNYIDIKEINSVLDSKKFYRIRYDWAKDIIPTEYDNLNFANIESFVENKDKETFEKNGINIDEEVCQKKFYRLIFKCTSSKVHSGFTENLEEIPNIIGTKDDINEENIKKNIEESIDLLIFCLYEILYACDM